MKMNKLERRSKRALYWVNEFRRDGDAEGEQMALARYREIERKMARSRARRMEGCYA